MAAKHTITVEITAQGKINCKPNIKTGIKRGDTITWDGASHKGHIQGKINDKTAAELEAMSSADIAKLPRDPSAMPFSPPRWHTGEVMTVSDNAAPGAYKYSISIAGQPEFDPVIILDP